MRLKSPSLALICLLKLEKAYRQGIDIRLHVGTSLEHLYPQEGHLLIWEASWDLALKMASNGKPLEVRLEEREKGYRLVFTTQPPLMLDASELLYLQDLCQKNGVDFLAQLEQARLELVFSKNPTERGEEDVL